MTRKELKPEIRELLKKDWSLRAKISLDLVSHERTIWRWIISNNPKLAEPTVLASIKKHTGSKTPESDMILLTEVKETYLHQ